MCVHILKPFSTIAPNQVRGIDSRPFCAAGTVPFKARNNMELYKEISQAPLAFPDGVFVSNSLRHLLTKLLDKDPDTRISLNGVLSHPWVTHNGLRPIPGFKVKSSIDSSVHSKSVAESAGYQEKHRHVLIVSHFWYSKSLATCNSL